MAARNTERPVFRKPLPDGVVEITNVTSGESSALVDLQDGSLMLVGGNNFRFSNDNGLTWGEPKHLDIEGLVRQGLSCILLQSGKLALAYRDKEDHFKITFSANKGSTWEGAFDMNLLGFPYYDTLIQTENEKLLIPSRACFNNKDHPGLDYLRVSSWGLWNGLPLQVAGHYHFPEIDVACVSYSEDGKTWEQCPGKLMGWFDTAGIPNGRGGITACDEPSIAETNDGRILFFARSTVGRLVHSYSSDEGKTWTAVRPTELASSYSPPRLSRIPKTGDLLCIWNQVSREEILRGYRRGRLSAAISKDSGLTWQGFKTIELSAGIEDTDRIPQEYPLAPIIGLPDVGTLPEDFTTFDYANACFSGDDVFIMYHRSWVEVSEEGDARTAGERMGKPTKAAETVLRRYPLEWFYQ